MNYTFAQFNPAKPEHKEVAGVISAWSEESDSMLSYTLDVIESHPLGMLAFSESGILAGYIAVVEIHKTERKARIGAFAVASELQGNGVGSGLISEIIAVIPGAIPEIDEVYAFVHPDSQKRFENTGFTEVGQRHPPSQTGCNTIVSINLSHISG